MFVRIACCVLLISAAVNGTTFSITPSTFVPGVTSLVNMRCDVKGSGNDLSQLLLIQLEVMDRGNLVPVVSYTPGGPPRVMEVGLAANVKVEGTNHQVNDIDSSFLSVTYPFPRVDVAGNYTCVVSGLSQTGLLTRYTQDARIEVGAVNELPLFMTAHVVELRSLIEQIKTNKTTLLAQAEHLRLQEANVTSELSSLESESLSVANEVAALKSRASQLFSILNQQVTDLDHLSSVRPGMKVAFHAALSDLGARTAVLHTPLVFDHVITNEGQGYNPATGVFRAPLSGTYLFTVSVQAGSGNRDSELSIMMGHKTILQTMHMSDDVDYHHSTTTTIAHVQAGGEVTCEFTWLNGLPGYVGSTQADAPYVTAFTGYILW